MNLKEIKDAARKAFSDQQSQDTEGGVPDAVSFIAGFVEGARHLEAELNEVELREVKANRLVVDLARQLTSLQSAFDDRVRVIEMQLEDKKKLVEALKFYANQKSWYGLSREMDMIELSDCEPAESIIHDAGVMLGGKRARQALKEVGEE